MRRTRVVRVKRLGIRTAATKAALLNNIGKWALPQASNPDTAPPSTSQASPTLSRWAPGSGSAFPTGLGKWARIEPNQVQSTSASRGRNSSPTVNPTGGRLGQWARPVAPGGVRSTQHVPSNFIKSQQGGMPSRDKFERKGEPEAVQFQREAAPHTATSARQQANGKGNITSAYDRTSGKMPQVDGKNEQRKIDYQDGKGRTATYITVGPIEDEDDKGNTRKKPARGGKAIFKERGSLVAQLSNNGVIPNHSRAKTSAFSSRPKEREKKYLGAPKKVNRDIFIPSVVSVGNLARLLNVRLERLQGKMTKAGMREQTSYDHMLSAEYASLIAMEFNMNPIVNDEAAFDLYPPVPRADQSILPPRPPVVTIMGHVDHGKTTLLDTLRSTSVAKGEAGGITQHIGAFSVPVPTSPMDHNTKRIITFLDTPGHAAFSAMRARGASVTDIVVLVVAADDGIMPQTREVLDLVKKEAGKVGFVVAINKIDKTEADISKVETALFAEGVQLEALGGEVPSVHVSGLTGQGLPQLVETVSLLAELQDLRADTSGSVHGYVLESKVHKGLGNVATVLVLCGELKPGTHMLAGTAHGKVRLLHDSAGKPLKNVLPGTAAVVSGWKELPKAGDEVLSGSESDIKRALANRVRKAAEEALVEDAEAINQSRREERERRGTEEKEDVKAEPAAEDEKVKRELRVVLKGDVSGSVEAVEGALQGIGNNIAGVKVVATGVGDVSESDISRAKAVDGIVAAFSVNVPRSIETLAVGQSVRILKSSIIYQLMDFVKERVIDLLPVTIEKKVTGEANVLQLFEISVKAKQTMKVAGCRVINGTIEKNKMARVVRGGEVVYEGKLQTLRQIKRDITEASKGLECGMAFEGWDQLREGDLVQSYQQIEKPGTL